MTNRSRLLILLALSACHTWTHVRTPEEAVARAPTGTLQVTKTDSSVVLIQSATIRQDTLIGTSPDREHRRIAIPMDEVSSVATKELSTWRTAGAGYLAVVAALGVALAILSVSVLGGI
jgi:hypothetical protein